MRSFCENFGCCRNSGGRKSEFGGRHPKIFLTQTQSLPNAFQKLFRVNIDPRLTQSWPYVKISHFSTKNRLLAKLRWSKMRIRGAGGRKKFRPELQICISVPKKIFRSMRYLESDSWKFPGGRKKRPFFSPPWKWSPRFSKVWRGLNMKLYEENRSPRTFVQFKIF